MLTEFQANLKKEELCPQGARVLLAVSGGIDSVVMAHLFSRQSNPCSIAHCNFQLRGTESEADEQFVRRLAGRLDMPVYVRRFDVEAEVRSRRVSLQMAARDLRYAWFGELADKEGFDVIATAHTLDDSVETFFMHLIRGPGLRGLTGIPPRNGKVIRPLLFARREELVGYARSHRLSWREDSSNADIRYRRNHLRHEVIPRLLELEPSFTRILQETMGRLQDTSEVIDRLVEGERARLFHGEEGRWRVEIGELKKLRPLNFWLFEFFSPFGFTRSQCESLPQILEAPPGKRLLSPTHQLFKDRAQLLLVKTRESAFERYYLDGPGKPSTLPFPLDMEVTEREQLSSIPMDPEIACMDLDTVPFPLTIRHWLPGDSFRPLGMDRTKKLSDFFVDEKVPVPEKERIWILASGKTILWVMGYRIDHRFRITGQTRRVLLLRIHADVRPQGPEKLL